jgi:hypothetical protein
MRKYTDGEKIVEAENYKEAAKKIFGLTYYPNPGSITGIIPTTYVYIHNGYAEVLVYNVGDKQGTYWGVGAATPKRYTLRRI